MKSLLLVIDLQNVFINKETEKLPDKINELINQDKYDIIAFTKFINSQGSIYTQKLNWNKCIKEEERKIVIDTRNYRVFEKNIYSAVNHDFIEYIDRNKITDIYLCGIDTECCILKSAFDLFEAGYNVYVLKNYCASTCGIERHNNAIKILERNIGGKYII